MNKQKGFTLIELMIILAICAILAAVMLPMVSENEQREGETTEQRTDSPCNK